jgi:hypothetical protein
VDARQIKRGHTVVDPRSIVVLESSG